MFKASYPASFLLEENGKGFHVRFRDLPEALTGGDDLEDTRAQAADCLAEAIAGRIARGDEIPQPSKARRGQHLISVPLYLAPKLALYLAMRGRRIPNTELAKRLGVSETVVRRMLNPKDKVDPIVKTIFRTLIRR
jgi:antitoxin HicB